MQYGRMLFCCAVLLFGWATAVNAEPSIAWTMDELIAATGDGGDQCRAVVLARETGAREVVTTVDASMTIEETGLDVVRTRVGDTAVSEELLKRGEFGGEPSGSWIFPQVSLCPDALYAAATAVSIASKGKLSQIFAAIPSYSLIRGSVAVTDGMPSDLESRLLLLMPLSTSNSDGVKLHFADGWLLVRASGTEPKVRLTVEAKTEARAQQIYDAGLAVISSSLHGGAN